MVAYKCGQCRTELESDLKLAGKTDPCPRCGHANQVPQKQETPPDQTSPGIILAVAVVLGIGGYYWWSSPNSKSTPKSQASLIPLLSSEVQPPLPPSGPIEIKVDPEVDERLFLLRVLDDLYHQFPSAQSDPKVIESELGRLRFQGTKFKLYIKNKNLGGSLADLYDDFVAAVDAYGEFLATIDRIERTAVHQAERDAAETGFEAGLKGGSVAADAYNQGRSGGDSAALGILVTVASGAFDFYQKNQQLQEAKEQAAMQAIKIFKDKISTNQAQLEVVAADLTSKYGWKKGETGFGDEVEETQMAKFSTEKNTQAVTQLLTQRLASRPRDPIFQAWFIQNIGIPMTQESATMVKLAEVSVQCADLVPEGTIYDSYRLRFLYEAGDIANRAFSADFPTGGIYSGRPNPTAAFAVQVWDACLRYGSDPSGEIRERRAWALGANGDLRAALAQAQEVIRLRGQTQRFAYHYACIQSRLGNAEAAYQWLDYAIKLGFNRTTDIKANPDLAFLRSSKAADFEQLVAIKYDWHPHWGLLNDDIVFTNDSNFALTNMTLEVRLEQDGRRWSLNLNADVIAAGQTYTWENVVSIPGGRLTDKNVTLSCDQNR